MDDAERIRRLTECLEYIRSMAEDRADADCRGDPPRYVTNDWMHVQVEIDDVLENTRCRHSS